MMEVLTFPQNSIQTETIDGHDERSGGMSNITAGVINHYMAVWNEPDAADRLKGHLQ
jgi:hypothetical protein